jgi:acyl carrier protein
MNREIVIEKMKDFLRKALFNENLDIQPHHYLQKDLGIDSMGAVEFISMVEDEYGIMINEEELGNIETFLQAVDLVMEKINQKK